MPETIMHIFTRTPLHIGAGSSVGAIDMPIQRERHTQIPIIPGSGLKGVLRDLWRAEKEEQRELFGNESNETDQQAGNLLIGEGRCVFFPVRSAQGSFAWLTCPLALARYLRDSRSNLSLDAKVFDLAGKTCLAGEGIKLNRNTDKIVLEEYCFDVAGEVPAEILHLGTGILPNDPIWKMISSKMVIVADGIFSYFCANACEVQQRIKIDEDTNTVAEHALFNQENVPSETLFYSVMGSRTGKQDHLTKLQAKLATVNNVIQLGGDATIGLGFCSVELK